jgi:hypothetical protein
MPDEVFADMKVDVFTEYFLALLKNPEFKSAEVQGGVWVESAHERNDKQQSGKFFELLLLLLHVC